MYSANHPGPFGALRRETIFEAVTTLGEDGLLPTEEKATVLALQSSFRAFSDWNATHSVRVGIQLRNFLEVLGYSHTDASRIGFCACVHDIGKLSVPLSLLNKNGVLSDEEREIVSGHVVSGLEVLECWTSSNRDVARVLASTHHENFDGTGYPYNLRGSEIPDIGQAIRIIDFFDAVNFDRPYRQGLGVNKTLDLMENSRGAVNSDLFMKFRQNISHIYTIKIQKTLSTETI
jgi:HD-GYP domain-containing protein (c-di-GMP phosphodiesterase class II)